MPDSKSIGRRIRLIDEAINNVGKRWPSNAELLEILERKLDRTISKSTLEKDIAFMKSMDAPIYFNKVRGGYEYTEPGYSFNQFPVSDEDMDAIRLAAETLNQFNHIPVFKQFQSAIKKINEKLKMTEAIGEDIITKTVMFESTPMATGVEYIGILAAAIRNRQKLRIEYENIYKGQIKEYLLDPYLLKEYRNRWYLVTWCEERNDFLTFGLDRVINIEVLRPTYAYRKEFQPDLFFKYSIGITEFDRKPVDIVLVFSPVVGKLIKRQPLHHTQEIVSDTKNGLSISLRLLLTEELIQTLLAHGSKVTVEKPEELKSEIRKRLEAALKNY